MSRATTIQKNFLHHVGGLRGLAITLVILFHLNPDWCRNGFYGVDVFLVISGYFLYKGYLNRQQSYNTLLSFGASRITRLFPSVLVLLAAFHLISILVLDPREWWHNCSSAIAGLLGYANVYFDRETQDYFAADSSRYPLLHLWYLAVILHFYIVFAICFILLKNISTKARWTLLICIGCISLVISEARELPYLLVNQFSEPRITPPGSVYYWSSGRFWECIAGMIIVHLPELKNNTLKAILFLAGILGIVIPSFITGGGEFLNVVAVVSTMLVIAYVPTGISSKLLDNPVLLFLGKISFSLYLWHFLIFNIWKHYTYWELSTPCDYLCMLCASLIASWVMWKLVEKRKFSFSMTACAWCIMLCATYVTTKYCLIPIKSHIPKLVFEKEVAYEIKSTHGTPYEKLDREARFTTWKVPQSLEDNKVAYLGDTTKAPHILLMGDSHAQAYVPGMNTILQQMETAAIYAISRPLPFCDNGFSLQKKAEHQNMTEQILNYLSSQPELTTIIVSCYWGREFKNRQQPDEALKRFCEEVRKTGKKLILITDTPTLPEPRLPWYMTFCNINGITPRRDVVMCTEETYLKLNQRAITAMKKLECEGLCHVIHVEPFLFRQGIFNSMSDDGFLLMYDENHITTYGSMYYAQKIKDQLQVVLGQ